ncbi:MAG TPA: hypothetical protein VF874_12160 [Mycobacterium sp.]
MTKDNRGWPAYILSGRLRTSTVALIVAFLLVWWIYEANQPEPAPPQAPETQVVPPGFVPDPNYTWVPRTNVWQPTETTTPTPTPTTTETETTSPTDTTTSGPPTTSPTPTSPTPTSPSPTPPAPAGAPTQSPTSAAPGPEPSPTPSR